ncbi:MAG: asparaginase [Alphaproteobacteria bacterium]|nr:asparaginase [Alphaproteobacteria bacterium]
MSRLPVIQVFALGGTIAMTPGASAGVIPSLTATELVSAVPGIDKMAEIQADTLAQQGSANLTFEIIADVIRRVNASDADAFIVTQGTDSMEESAFLASLMYRGDKPIIFTGAMRAPGQLSADGPANLYSAVIAATDPAMGGVGLMMNNELHDPWYVAKEHTSSLQAFVSEHGPAASITEGRLYWPRPMPQHALARGVPERFAAVALVSTFLDDDGRILDALPDMGYEGVVIEGLGAGHLPEGWADKAEELARHMPVILASRAKGGRVFERTYGYKGAEIDLIARGLVPAGGLRSRKARLLLSCLLGANVTNWNQTFTAAVKSV